MKTIFLALLFLVSFGWQMAHAVDVLTALLPFSRSVQIGGQPATAFAVMINVSGRDLTNCRFNPVTVVPANFSFQKTNAANAVIGAVGEAADIPAGGIQNFVFVLEPTAPIDSTEITFNFFCDGAEPAPVSPGVNTFLFSASTDPIPDILSIGAVLSNDGIINVPGTVPPATGVMSVAAINLGAAGAITVEATKSNANIPGSAVVCETDPTTGGCQQTPAQTISTTIAAVGSGPPSTFTTFITSPEPILFDPANTRISVVFRDATGNIRGATSAALRTRDIVQADDDENGVWDDVDQNVSQFLDVTLPGDAQAVQIATPALQNFQNSLLFSDLSDVSIDNAADLDRLIACLFLLAGNEERATDIVRSLDTSILTNNDRLQASLTQVNNLAGVVFTNSRVTTAECQ